MLDEARIARAWHSLLGLSRDCWSRLKEGRRIGITDDLLRLDLVRHVAFIIYAPAKKACSCKVARSAPDDGEVNWAPVHRDLCSSRPASVISCIEKMDFNTH